MAGAGQRDKSRARAKRAPPRRLGTGGGNNSRTVGVSHRKQPPQGVSASEEHLHGRIMRLSHIPRGLQTDLAPCVKQESKSLSEPRNRTRLAGEVPPPPTPHLATGGGAEPPSQISGAKGRAEGSAKHAAALGTSAMKGPESRKPPQPKGGDGEETDAR